MKDLVRAELAARARPDKALDTQAYLKSAMPLYGVPRAGHREIARALPPLDGFAAWRGPLREVVRGGGRRATASRRGGTPCWSCGGAPSTARSATSRST